MLFCIALYAIQMLYNTIKCHNKDTLITKKKRNTTYGHIVATEQNDPICHFNECQIGSFSSVATILVNIFNMLALMHYQDYGHPTEWETLTSVQKPCFWPTQGSSVHYLSLVFLVVAHQRLFCVLKSGSKYSWPVSGHLCCGHITFHHNTLALLN